MPSEKEHKAEPIEKGGTFQVSKEKLQDLRAKFNQLQQQHNNIATTGNSQSLKFSFPNKPTIPPQPENAVPMGHPSEAPIVKGGVTETKMHSRTFTPQTNSNAESTKVRFTIAKDTDVLQTHSVGITSSLGKSSKIIITQPPGTPEQVQKTCMQQLPMLLDVSQNILEKVLYEIRRISPDLDLPHYCHKSLKCLEYEAMKLAESSEKMYKTLYEVLQHKIYVMVLFGNQENQWSSIPFKTEDSIFLQQQPCKVLYLLLRLLALFLHSIQHKLSKEQSTLLSLRILQILENVTNFLKKGRRFCSLKAMYHFARHNPLSKDFICHVYEEDQPPVSIKEDIFTIQSPPPSEFSPNETSSRISSAKPISKSNPTNNSVFHGDLAYINISQVLQILDMQHKTGCLTVKGNETIKIFLNQGMVVHAQSDSQVGEEAFYQVLLLERGYFAFILESPSQTTMNYPIEFLLMEGSRRIDEQKRDQNT